MEKVTIIIPIYNVEKYIARCIDSILAQNYENLELILVNDGSTDGVETIINTYLEKYPNIIKYIKKENTGLSDTRNIGIQKSTGEYIMFVDSDDYVCDNYFSIIVQKVINVFRRFNIVHNDADYCYSCFHTFLHKK